MLKKFDELTEEQQKLCYLMYSDKDTVTQYLYNFDDKGKYIGRQYTPPVGVIHAESTVPGASKPMVVLNEEQKKIVKEVAKDEKPKAKRSHKK